MMMMIYPSNGTMMEFTGRDKFDRASENSCGSFLTSFISLPLLVISHFLHPASPTPSPISPFTTQLSYPYPSDQQCIGDFCDHNECPWVAMTTFSLVAHILVFPSKMC
ncbi:hypothetical protein EVAR_99302_1 [Eumeta japonica]|uniref:Uncharacterized protein n=1 Tax=Eumeta variegata TaxID=151549 RepID=A0A4C1YX33_EUMVA|nr:hypothetical protein EVAR_99302_1 [Eumeta japonica]